MQLYRALGVVAVLTFGLAISSIAAIARADRLVALVIGNAAYEVHAGGTSFDMSFQSPVKDATDVGALLNRRGFRVTQVENADQRSFRQVLNDFARVAARADAAVIYFSGFSRAVPEASTYLVPVDARGSDQTDLEFEGIPLDLIVAAVSRSLRSGMVIVDGACREPSTTEGPNPGRDQESRIIVVACAGPSAGSVLDGEDGGNSPFTRALLAHFEEATLPLGRVFAMIKGEVLTATWGFQEPLFYGSDAALEATLGEFLGLQATEDASR